MSFQEIWPPLISPLYNFLRGIKHQLPDSESRLLFTEYCIYISWYSGCLEFARRNSFGLLHGLYIYLIFRLLCNVIYYSGVVCYVFIFQQQHFFNSFLLDRNYLAWLLFNFHIKYHYFNHENKFDQIQKCWYMVHFKGLVWATVKF